MTKEQEIEEKLRADYPDADIHVTKVNTSKGMNKLIFTAFLAYRLFKFVSVMAGLYILVHFIVKYW